MFTASAEPQEGNVVLGVGTCMKEAALKVLKMQSGQEMMHVDFYGRSLFSHGCVVLSCTETIYGVQSGSAYSE